MPIRSKSSKETVSVTFLSTSTVEAAVTRREFTWVSAEMVRLPPLQVSAEKPSEIAPQDAGAEENGAEN